MLKEFESVKKTNKYEGKVLFLSQTRKYFFRKIGWRLIELPLIWSLFTLRENRRSLKITFKFFNPNMVIDLKIIIFFKLILEILFIHHQNYLSVARISKTTILIPSALIFIVWESLYFWNSLWKNSYLAITLSKSK